MLFIYYFNSNLFANKFHIAEIKVYICDCFHSKTYHALLCYALTGQGVFVLHLRLTIQIYCTDSYFKVCHTADTLPVEHLFSLLSNSRSIIVLWTDKLVSKLLQGVNLFFLWIKYFKFAKVNKRRKKYIFLLDDYEDYKEITITLKNSELQ